MENWRVQKETVFFRSVYQASTRKGAEHAGAQGIAGMGASGRSKMSTKSLPRELLPLERAAFLLLWGLFSTFSDLSQVLYSPVILFLGMYSSFCQKTSAEKAEIRGC